MVLDEQEKNIHNNPVNLNFVKMEDTTQQPKPPARGQSQNQAQASGPVIRVGSSGSAVSASSGGAGSGSLSRSLRSASLEEDSHSVRSAGSGSQIHPTHTPFSQVGTSQAPSSQHHQPPLQPQGHPKPPLAQHPPSAQKPTQQFPSQQGYGVGVAPPHPPKVDPPNWDAVTPSKVPPSEACTPNASNVHSSNNPVSANAAAMTPIQAPDFSSPRGSPTNRDHTSSTPARGGMSNMPSLPLGVGGATPIASGGNHAAGAGAGGSSVGGGASVGSQGGGHPVVITPVPSMTNSYESGNVSPMAVSCAGGFSQQSHSQQQHQHQHNLPMPPDLQGLQSKSADSSVLLGLEELERQQADLEKRREAEAESKKKIMMEMQLKQQHQHQQPPPRQHSGLPPLAPVSSHDQQQQYRNQQAHYSAMQYPHQYPKNIPTQIHLLDQDEDTALSSEVVVMGSSDGKEDDMGSSYMGENTGDNVKEEEKDSLKRVMSIEKFGKYIKNKQQVSFRRFRSWSQDRASIDHPGASSVDSTQNASLSRASYSAAGGVVAPKKSTAAAETKVAGDIQEPYLDEDELKPLIYGYLHKLGRNGHWQKRFFETNGERLTYYKSVKRTKVLATLDLCKVGEIAIDKTDPEQCTFTIQVSNRPYYLRAEDKARCNDWVIILNRAKEARMNVGNIQLVTPKLKDPHRSQAGSDDYAPCIVISALRPRTQAVNFDGSSDLPPDLLTSTDEEQQQIEVNLGPWDHPHLKGQHDQIVTHTESHPYITTTPSLNLPMAKWQKRHSTMHQLSLRFLRWARSITKADACKREQDVIVVPAHVMRSMMTSDEASSSIGVSTSGSKQAAARVRRNPSDLPDLAEETPTKEEGSESTSNRSRADTSSPAFGSSRYV